MSQRPDELTSLGMPFPLFKAPSWCLGDPVLDRACVACGRHQPYLFGLHENDHLIEPCAQCDHPVPLPFRWPDDQPPAVPCERCGTVKHWPATGLRENAAVCHACLRAGRAAFAHEAEVGILDYPLAVRGMASERDERVTLREHFRVTVLHTYEDGSQNRGVHLPQDALFELLRTPRHRALQGEYWPWHCGGFTAYLGQWHQEDFEARWPGRGRERFAELLDDDDWENVWDWLPDETGICYVYQCPRCGEHRIYVDSD